MSNTQTNLILLGHGRHGKGTFGKIALAVFALAAGSSSAVANDLFMYEQLKDKYGYTSAEQCYADRANHRQEWFEGILAFNTPNRTALAEAVFQRFPIYDGIRSRLEFDGIRRKGLFSLAIWIDGSERHPLEPGTSFELTKADADIVIDNNTTPLEFFAKVVNALRMMGYPTAQGVDVPRYLLPTGDLAVLAAQTHAITPLNFTITAEHDRYDGIATMATVMDQYGQSYFRYWLGEDRDDNTWSWGLLPLTDSDLAELERGEFELQSALRTRQVLMMVHRTAQANNSVYVTDDVVYHEPRQLDNTHTPNEPFYPLGALGDDLFVCDDCETVRDIEDSVSPKKGTYLCEGCA
jgi:hypothetical protein